METRPYQAGDEQAILGLFHLAFNKTLPPETWRWRYLDNPFGPAIIQLMWDGETLAGHYAVSSVELKVGSQSLTTGLTLDVMTHPKYVGRGIFTTLARSAHEEMRLRGGMFIWGFPNTESHYGFRKNLKWGDICQIPMLHLDLDRSRMPEIQAEGVSETHDVDQRFDQLWEKVGPGLGCAVVRGQRFLKWRYLRNPSHTYHVLVSPAGEDLEGYAIVKNYRYGGSLYVDLVDLLAVPTALDALLAATVRHARREGALGIMTWMNVHHPAYLRLDAAGFVPGVPVTYLAGRAFEAGDAWSSLIEDSRAWYFAMGDSDVY